VREYALTTARATWQWGLEFCERRTIVARPELGNKLVCTECETKFYDLGKPSPVCPACGASQAPGRPEPKPKPVAEEVKPEAAPETVKDDAGEVVEADAGAAAAGLEIVSLDDADADADAEVVDDEDEVAAVADLGIEDVEIDDDGDDETEGKDVFLVADDDDGTDMSDIVGAPIGKGDGDT